MVDRIGSCVLVRFVSEIPRGRLIQDPAVEPVAITRERSESLARREDDTVTRKNVMPANAGIQATDFLDSRLRHAGMTRKAVVNRGILAYPPAVD